GPIFIRGDHANGPHLLFAGSGETCRVDEFRHYRSDCAFTGKAAARYYARRLLEFYHDPDPAPELVRALADELAAANYNLNPALRKLFLSATFYAKKDAVPEHPVERIVGFLRSFGYGPFRTLPYDLTSGNGPVSAMNRMEFYFFNIPAPEGHAPAE